MLCTFQALFFFRLINFMSGKLLWKKKQFQCYESIFLSPKEKNRGFKVVALRSLPLFFLRKSFSLWASLFCHVAVVTIWEYQCLNDTFFVILTRLLQNIGQYKCTIFFIRLRDITWQSRGSCASFFYRTEVLLTRLVAAHNSSVKYTYPIL